MWDFYLQGLYISFNQENEYRKEQGLKPLTFKQYIRGYDGNL